MQKNKVSRKQHRIQFDYGIDCRKEKQEIVQRQAKACL